MEQNKILNIAKKTDDQIEKFSNIDASTNWVYIMG